MNVFKMALGMFRIMTAPQGAAKAFKNGRIPAVTAFLSQWNPFRDLPTDANVVHALREVRYIERTLRYLMVPTSLPGDDYALCSTLLRSLETRQDLSWLVLRETGVQDTIQVIARRGGIRTPIPDEPFGLHERAKTLDRHWHTLERNPAKPREWEAEFSSQRQPPLIRDEDALVLSLTQVSEAETMYRQWRTDRDWKVSYLKRHPPVPTGYVRVTRNQVHSDETWRMLPTVNSPDDGTSQHDTCKLLPIYASLVSQRVPLNWVNPDVVPVRRKRTDQKNRRDEQLKREHDRRSRQWEYQKQLKANRES
ncbi:hypothetical protein FZEAL_140 [Fusarium zealandicum]|uniref:Uncharacterized protein n=1 Tax=Fusarium zealandicum TaxID=1053134 RepID=A0A8H4UVV9_9HYPO|nr:hypothetical protein FZEAL_140 [Fusarium zealandicum]